MAPSGYMILVKATENSTDLMLAVLNTAGSGQALYGESGSAGSAELWIIPKGKRTKPEVISLLQALPTVRSVLVAVLSKPVAVTELGEVRNLFADVGWDASSVSDDDLSLFVNAILQGQYTYYVDFDVRKKREGPVKISIKPLQEHPDFSPDSLKQTAPVEEELEDKVFTMDDFEVRTVEITSTVEVPPPPPPPPDPNDRYEA